MESPQLTSEEGMEWRSHSCFSAFSEVMAGAVWSGIMSIKTTRHCLPLQNRLSFYRRYTDYGSMLMITKDLQCKSLNVGSCITFKLFNEQIEEKKNAQKAKAIYRLCLGSDLYKLRISRK